MKKSLFLTLVLSLFTLGSWAAKTVYIPSTWVYDSSTQEYTEGGNSDLQWSYNRSKQSDNCIVFWQKGFGTNPKTASISFDPDAVLQVAENCYAMNVNTLGFNSSNMVNKYKMMILVSYTNDWVCYGGGYDFECSALWIGPSAVNPAGHSLAHEVGHSFHYMCYAEAANYSHTSSSTINTGFHLNCGNGQAIWEQTAQWQANQSYPDQMFSQSYPLFGNNANYAFSHEHMRYQSYWFHYYLSDLYNDKTIVSQIWKQPMTGQSSGNATDFCQAYIALKGLTASQFYATYFDYALKCATFDFTEAASYRNNYIGNFDYYCSKLGTKQYQVAYASCPQSTGFNVIELTVPSSGTTITTAFTALTHACDLNECDPGQYNDGNANSLVKAGVTKYNSAGTASYRGFRVGYVFLKSDGTRVYYNDNTIHCTGTTEKTENISTTVPANTSRIFLVVTPALTNYVKHAWDDNVLNDDQWPYRFTLTNTDLKNANVFTEAIPDEPEFTKVIDGRAIADVTLTYNVILAPSSSDYTGAGVTFNTGSAVNALCTAFQMESSNIFGHVIDYTASQSNGTIMSCAVNSSGNIQSNAHNTNGTFGHWFNSSGTVVSWGSSCVAFTEINDQYTSGTIGQYPGTNSNGNTRTIREALVYKNSSGKTAKATFVYNITFKTGATPTAYLTDIDYTEPTVTEGSMTAYRATSIPISVTVTQGETAESALTVSTVCSALNNLTNSYLTNATYFKGYSTSPTSGNNVYYYALSGAPTATTSAQGTMTYYQTASVTTDTEFSGQYVHYFDANGSCTDTPTKAKIKVAYDRANAKFTVKPTSDCPVGSYTVYVGMLRRNNQNRNYVAFFPLAITVEGQPGETIDIDRYPGQGYTAQQGSVDFTAAKQFLGVTDLTTDMLRIVNPDGTQISDYSGYDGWFDADGVATTWGSTTKVCVKFFQAISSNTFDICDMNSADVVGTTYTVKWALVANSKTYTFTINVNFVERPAPELFYDDLTILDTQEVSVESQVGSSYEGLTANVNMSSILTTLGVSSINDLTVYAVQADGSLEDNYQLGGTDGWRDADGSFQSWGDNAYFCMKADFTLSENQIHYIGGMQGKNTADEATYTAKYAFVDASNNAVVLNAKLIYKLVPLYLTDFTIVKSYALSLTTDSVKLDYSTDALALDVADIQTALGLSTLDNTKFYATLDGSELTSVYTANNGYYLNGDGYPVAYAEEAARFFVETDRTQLTIGQKPGVCAAGDTFTTTLYLGDEATSKLVALNIIYRIKAVHISLRDTDTEYNYHAGQHSVSLVRSLPAGRWLTFCSPFNIDKAQQTAMGIAEARELVGFDIVNGDLVLQFDSISDGGAKDEMIREFKPCIIRMAEAKDSIFMEQTFYDAMKTPTLTVTSQDGTKSITMTGTFIQTDVPDGAYYLQDGKLRHHTGVEGTTAINGWRAYFTISGIQFGTKTQGDLNGDNVTTLADLTQLVNIANGEVSAYDFKVANLYGDDNIIDNKDIAEQVQIMIGKKSAPVIQCGVEAVSVGQSAFESGVDDAGGSGTPE